MGKLKKVCATIGGAAIISAAVMGMVSASTAGLGMIDKGFIYDAEYRPKVQIVVGEKAAAEDVVGAGDIAATIGNLAYKPIVCGGDAGGEVKLAVKSWRIVGQYEQDIKGRFVGGADLGGTALSESFYRSPGQEFANGTLEYRRGMLRKYEIGCRIGREVADFPMKDKFCNEICYLCYDICIMVKFPEHEMEETIKVDGTRVRYYQDGLGCDAKPESLKMRIESGALKYEVKLDGIPTALIREDPQTFIDTPYRGKMLFMGSKEYYVNDLSDRHITLAKGEKLWINAVDFKEPTLPEFQGYKFKLIRIIRSAGRDAGIEMEIERPDGTIVRARAIMLAPATLAPDAKGRRIQVQAFQVVGEEASIIVYDLATQYRLEHGKKIEGWRVDIGRKRCNEVGIEQYGTKDRPAGNANNVWCLTHLTLSQDDVRTLDVGSTVFFPAKTIRFSFEGFKDENFGDPVCSGGADRIKIDTEGTHIVRLSFTTRDGQRLNNVRLDEGGYTPGESFLIGNIVYKFKEAEEIDGGERVKLSLRDVSNAMDFEVKLTRVKTLTPKGNHFDGFNYTKFDRYSDRLENECRKDCPIFNGTIPQLPNVTIIYHGGEGKLWMDRGGDAKIGLNAIRLTDIENENCPAELKTVFELEEGNINADNNTDDHLIEFIGCGEDVAYIDLYDTARHARKGDFHTTVKIRDKINKTKEEPTAVLKCDEDTKLWSPRGGDLFIARYGANEQIKGVEICHPMRRVYMTYFLGKEKEEADIIGTVTAADVGKLKTVGCCEFIVRSFGLAGVNATTCMKVAPVGKLMVLDKEADRRKNLIVVGGPAVNKIAKEVGITAEEIEKAPGKYIIKLVNNTLVVAGWEAKDTRAATDKFIEWLKANIHA